MEVKLHEINCFKCSVSFWITKKHYNDLASSHKTFYCTNSHAQYFSQKSKAEIAEEKAKQAIISRDRYKGWLANEQEENKSNARSNAVLRGVITKQKKARNRE